MNLEARKINLINWISSIQEEDILTQMEKIQRERADWWDSVNDKDKEAVIDGLDQLDKGDFITRSQVRNKIRDKFNF